MSEKEEINSIRNQQETKSIHDISNSKQNQIAEKIHKIFNQALENYESNPNQIQLQEIIVCGSFAENNAIENISDLDIGLILNKQPKNPNKIKTYIKENYDTSNNIFGYIDTQLRKTPPNTKHVTIWKN